MDKVSHNCNNNLKKLTCLVFTLILFLVTTAHLGLLNDKLWDVHHEWEQFGRALPVDESVIGSLRRANSNHKEDREKLQEALERWRKKGGNRTWQVIHTALGKIRKKNVADEILEKYPNPETKGIL